MFKVYQVSITGIEPFRQTKSFIFGPYFNLIRGDNGAGKTTVLETIALLGHCSIMTYEESFDINKHKFCYIEYKLIVGECFFSDKNNSEIRRLAEIWRDATTKSGDNGTVTKRPTEISVYIYHKDNKAVNDLKADLKDESKLRTDWRIAGDERQVAFLKRLIEFSRPLQLQSEMDLLTQKIRETVIHIGHAADQKLLNEEGIAEYAKQIITLATNTKSVYKCPERSRFIGQDVILPPFICYFNTDMYHYGIGLDIRESPKHLSQELPGLVRDRLHLVTRGNQMANLLRVKDLWTSIFRGENLKGEAKGVLENIIFENDEATITIIGAGNEVRNFMSSGENQALSLSIPLMVLEPKHSILLLDEPELHLSLPAAVKMYDEVVKRSLIDDIQIITVSHLPFVFPQSLHDNDEIITIGEFCAFHSRVKESVNALIEITSKSERRLPPYITLYYLKKEIKDGSITISSFRQKYAAEEAGKFQNRELDSIRRQTHSEVEWKTFLQEILTLTLTPFAGNK